MYTHDYEIISYQVDFEKGTFIFNIKGEQGQKKQIIFKEVLSYQFKHEMPYSIILDLKELPLAYFFSQNKKVLEDKERWSIRYKSPLELKTKIESMGLKYYNLYASYGMNGWILAESCELRVIED
ncbi:hypothetical protein SAMN04488559_10182 [Isobaculum melis]|uniref:Uncharacterized protein n=2 Tax=Isobaculum melis TaxID=142588 RepID=A0A1H9PQN8_9LACT|nr:hypothetical protein SAMN04488559_10182 [Isobaculum melis]